MDKLFFNYKEQFLEACNITGCVELFLDEKPSIRLKFSQKVRIKLILDEQSEGQHDVSDEDKSHTSALESVSMIINSNVESTEDMKDIESDSSVMRNSSPRQTRGATTRSAYAIGKGLGTRSSKTAATETNKPPSRAAAKSRKQPAMRCMVQKDYTLSACLYPDKPQKKSRSPSSTSKTRGKRKVAATGTKTLAPDRRLRTSSESRKPRVQRLVCKFCDKSFPDITVHRAHRRNPDSQTSCVVCEAQFPSHGELFLHCFQLHGAEFCQRRFPDIDISNDVIWPGGKKILRKKLVQCPVCSKEFLYHNMFDHILGHFAELSYKCCICGENLKARHVYLSHCEDHLAKLAGTRKKQRGRRRRTVSEEDTTHSSSSRDAKRHNNEVDSPDDDESEEEDEEEMDTTLPQAVSNKHQISANTKIDSVSVSHAEETTYGYSGTDQKSSSSVTQSANTKTFECKYCKETFPTSAKLRRHKRVPRASITCHTCGAVVSSQALMIIHEYEVHNIDHRMARPDGELEVTVGGDESMLSQPSNPRVCDKTQENDQRPTPTQFVPCPVCSSQVRRLYLPQHIMRLHTKEYLFRCCICQFPCSSHGKYKEHCSTHIGLGKKGRFTCSNCPQVFATQSEFVKHSQIHKTICHFCQVDFKHVALVERHYETEHSDQLFNCNQCNKRFAKEKNFKDHLRNHRFKTRQPCPKCGLMVKMLKTHMETQHPEPGNEACCPICGKRLKHEIGLRNHLRRHHASSNGETYPCPQCPKTFPNQDYLRAHINRHLGKSKIYECHICGKQCKERYNLKTHMQIHSATKRFTCLICQQGFNYKASLLGHMRSRHQQEVQFQC